MSACSCDYERPEFYARSTHRARVAHKCCECGVRILPGELYEVVRGKWDGDFGQFKTCCRCLALREWVVAHVPCSCWAHGNMREDVLTDAEHWGMQAPGLLFGALRREVLIRRGQRANGGGDGGVVAWVRDSLL